MISGKSKSHGVQGKALKRIAWGLVWMVCATWFWLHLVGNPIHDLRLMLWARTAPGHIVDTWEDVEDGDDGRAHWYHSAAYTFHLPDGREVSATTGSRSGRLRPEFVDFEQPIPIEVEYDPTNPSISRLKGEGCQSLVEWLFRKVCLGGLMFVLFVSPGVQLIRDGIRSFPSSRVC